MEKNLIILMGTTGVGKSAIAKEFSKHNNYSWISVDEIIKDKYPKKNLASLSKKETTEVLLELSKKTEKALIKGSVVVDERFYSPLSLDLFLTHIDEKHDKFLIHLTAGLKEILKRNSLKEIPHSENIIKKHYKETKNILGKHYTQITPRIIDTTNLTPLEVKENILNSLLFHNKLRIENSLKDFE